MRKEICLLVFDGTSFTVIPEYQLSEYITEYNLDNEKEVVMGKYTDINEAFEEAEKMNEFC